MIKFDEFKNITLDFEIGVKTRKNEKASLANIGSSFIDICSIITLSVFMKLHKNICQVHSTMYLKVRIISLLCAIKL